MAELVFFTSVWRERMAEREVSVLIGGKAGDGISSAGQIIAHLLAQTGYRVHMYFDYPSLIKGGHNFAIIRAAEEGIGAVREQVDFILALNQETVNLHRHRLRERGVVIYDASTVKLAEGIGIPVKNILAAEEAPPVMGNSAIIGGFVRAAGLNWDASSGVLKKSMPKGTEKNLRVARRAYEASEERQQVPGTGKPVLPVLTGNEAISVGLVEADLEIYFSYPMSPTSNILHFLAGYADELCIRVIQPESEIAVILMALGCSYAGSRAVIGTSGGGFCLMTEALSLAGIAELPILVILGQRTGPSTGLATYSAQSDLHFALHAGQGEFPRLIIAPGDAGEARYWSRTVLDLAWKYQIPAIILSDRLICEGLYSVEPETGIRYAAGPVMADPAIHPYLRYAPADYGISPLRFPPAKGEIIRVNSHVHDTDGITTEDPVVTKEMADKRMKKMDGLAREIEGINSINTGGVTDAVIALLCWGSSKGVCEELGKKKGLRVIQPVVLWPFAEKAFARAMDGVEQFYAVETNESGQLATLVSRFGYRPSGKILKYDGRPFMVEELEAELKKVIS
ncbi:MAG: 2-oxoacid:acceptor oxidoreductase subunit alpha [Methanoregula sp.]|jgi:2-oxoglutarate ferredoxin oxidoreductase subunit alpha